MADAQKCPKCGSSDVRVVAVRVGNLAAPADRGSHEFDIPTAGVLIWRCHACEGEFETPNDDDKRL